MLIDFLKTKRSKKELKIALNIVKEFKACESEIEWMAIFFVTWVKLEQLEEYLEHLVNGQKLREDTLKVIEQHKRIVRKRTRKLK